MKLLDTDITQFKGLYRKHFGVELGTPEAYALLSLLVRQVQIVHQPITKQQLATYRAMKNEDENENENNDFRMA
jgi:hypothetical protein